MKNTIAFFEIPALDFNKAVKFYEAVLGIKLSVMDCGEKEKMAFFPTQGDECPGAISWDWKNEFRPSADGTLIHFNVENMETAITAIQNNGGKVVRPKTKIEAEGRGYFSLFIDCEGNRVGLYSDK